MRAGRLGDRDLLAFEAVDGLDRRRFRHDNRLAEAAR
jgi:hypothetical protein